MQQVSNPSTAILNSHILRGKAAGDSVETTGKSVIYLYGISELKKEFEDFRKKEKDKIQIYSEQYEPNPWFYQYDLEFYIFLNYERLSAKEKLPFPREYHLQRAIKIRWPSRILPDGAYAGNMVVNPWTEDLCCAISNYQNTILFGGAGQGKSYFFIAFMCMLFDHFIYTEKGAQCTFSTVSEAKLKGSTWPYVNKLYPVSEGRRKFSLYAGKGKIGADYSVNRVLGNKKIEKGGRFIGVLLAKGRKDASVIDKLTGCHDPLARAYLLDEAQSTDSAPLNAYTNMFLHPLYKWFFMAGNYETDGDLLELNIRPSHAAGWGAVHAGSHIWESVLRSSNSNSLDLVSCVIHLNNELSPAITSEEGRIKWRLCCPTIQKRDELYKTPESKLSYGYKRFWIGFRFERDDDDGEYVCTLNLIREVGADRKLQMKNPVFLGSFDSAPASKDRNIFTVFSIEEGPKIQIERVIAIKKASERLKYYRETTDAIVSILQEYGIESGHFIMDFTQHTALIEMLREKGIICHHLIYQETIPEKVRVNEISGVTERPIQLETIRRFVGDFERNVSLYAHQRIKNKITLGAYIFSMFLEKGLVSNLNETLLHKGNSEMGFEKEFCLRKFKKKKRKNMDILVLDSKEDFKNKYGFSPDICDTIYQLFYMIYVHFGIRTSDKSLGRLRENKNSQKFIDKQKNLWHNPRTVRSIPRG